MRGQLIWVRYSQHPFSSQLIPTLIQKHQSKRARKQKRRRQQKWISLSLVEEKNQPASEERRRREGSDESSVEVRDSTSSVVEIDKKTEKELRWEGRECRNMIIDSDCESDASDNVSNKIISISPYPQLDMSTLSLSTKKRVRWAEPILVEQPIDSPEEEDYDSQSLPDPIKSAESERLEKSCMKDLSNKPAFVDAIRRVSTKGIDLPLRVGDVAKMGFVRYEREGDPRPRFLFSVTGGDKAVAKGVMALLDSGCTDDMVSRTWLREHLPTVQMTQLDDLPNAVSGAIGQGGPQKVYGHVVLDFTLCLPPGMPNKELSFCLGCVVMDMEEDMIIGLPSMGQLGLGMILFDPVIWTNEANAAIDEDDEIINPDIVMSDLMSDLEDYKAEYSPKMSPAPWALEDKELQDGLAALFEEFSDVFSNDKKALLTPSKLPKMNIELMEGRLPPNEKLRRHSPAIRVEIEKAVNELLKYGVIEPSTSPYAANVVLPLEEGWYKEICSRFSQTQ